MHRTRTAARAACLLAALAGIVAATALPAFAMQVPPPPGGFTSTPARQVTCTLVAGGMPG